ncbi:hydroxysqualene dehydroxylase HpnE [Crenobacter caeni]|uniref:NAD(P)-binding protein n=1 Tax=Crenobacter caeni TaxID=2705474 RepID=A0A6B2KRE9_9NEIS|nr:hydroxysqualene dehydroxylase HpnE [Crenobacter caeni]NDV12815.1 NAD(P)-binding protein [Crenobacter caeni]
MSVKPRVAVVGAGWAGLSAAVSLSGFASLTVFEAGRQPGGRARRAQGAAGNFDNGQHILVGAYRATLDLMRTVGVDPEQALLRLPLSWPMLDALNFTTPALPSPLHVLAGLLAAKRLSWRDKALFLRALASLARAGYRVVPDMSVGQWLEQSAQTPALIDGFWRPLLLSALNTPPEIASMATFVRVLGDSCGGAREDGELLLPRTDLSSVLPEPAWRYLQGQGARCVASHRVKAVHWQDDGVWVDGERFDAVVLAVAPWHAAPLLPEDARCALQQWRTRPITTLYAQTDAVLPQVMTGLAHGAVHWLFDRARLGGEPGEIAAVLSCDEGLSDEALREGLARDLARACGRPVAVHAMRVIRERRATFEAAVALARPDTRLQVEYGYLAGDWVHPVYPATLEGAVQSGRAAATALMADWTHKPRKQKPK